MLQSNIHLLSQHSFLVTEITEKTWQNDSTHFPLQSSTSFVLGLLFFLFYEYLFNPLQHVYVNNNNSNYFNSRISLDLIARFLTSMGDIGTIGWIGGFSSSVWYSWSLKALKKSNSNGIFSSTLWSLTPNSVILGKPSDNSDNWLWNRDKNFKKCSKLRICASSLGHFVQFLFQYFLAYIYLELNIILTIFTIKAYVTETDVFQLYF